MYKIQEKARGDGRLMQSLPMSPSQPEDEEPARLQNPTLKDKKRANREREKKDWLLGWVGRPAGTQEVPDLCNISKGLDS
ncbi:hypothetical protein Nmel_006118 [Mimus melanotis]